MQNINIVFIEEEDGEVSVTVDYNIDTVSPEIVVQALYDLAEGEEKFWKRWLGKMYTERRLYVRRN